MFWSHPVVFRLDVMGLAANRTGCARVRWGSPPESCGTTTERSLIVLYARWAVNETCAEASISDGIMRQ